MPDFLYNGDCHACPVPPHVPFLHRPELFDSAIFALIVTDEIADIAAAYGSVKVRAM